MKIVIATGGTGGHIFPALQTACVLKNRGHEIIFVGVLGLGESKIKAQGFETVLIQAKGLTNKSPVGFLQFGFSMFWAMNQAWHILKQKRPDKVIGFGGYSSFAVVLCAWLLRIPAMIHEQNVVPGKANRILAKFVKKIAISFQKTKDFLDASKTVWTGCPCHHQKPLQSKGELLEKFSLDAHKKTILVLGGSQGSQKLNEVIFRMFSSWESVSDIQVIHMTGAKEYSLYVEKYRHSSIRVKVCDFISPIEEAYAISDVVIARAGASTIWELGFFMIPSIFVPYPLADGHQTYNAQVLSELGLATIIEQKNLTIEKLRDTLKSFLRNSDDRMNLKNKVEQIFNSSPEESLALALEDL